MAIKLNGSTSGSVSLDAPADTNPSGTDVTLTLPTSAGSSGQYLQTNGSGGLSWQTVADTGEVWTSNYQTPSSASSVLWTGLPTDLREAIVTFNNWTFGTSSSQICEIGTSSGLETSGYRQDQGYGGYANNGTLNTSNSNWGNSYFNNTSYNFYGTIALRKSTSGNTWVCHWEFGSGGNGYSGYVYGSKTLGGALERIQIRQGSGTFSGNFALHYLN